MRKLLVCAALMCVAFARAAGQEGGEPKAATPSFVQLGDAGAEAARLLQSNVNKERAWGAYLVGLHELRNETPALVSILEDESLASGGPEESFLRHAALDALIRLDAEVPAETLLPLYASAPGEVLILLARSPEKNQQALLGLFRDEARNVEWITVGNLLARTRAPGFAARLLGGLKIEARVDVYDRGGDSDLLGVGGGSGCGFGCGYTRDESLPPVGYYHLTAYASPGATVVAEGRHNVYYERTIWADYYCGGGYPAVFDLDLTRVEYVADLLGVSDDALGLDASPYREVVCEDARQCLAALAGVRDEIRRSHASAVARLLAEGLLDGAEAAGLKPDITLDITDYRKGKSFPLPDKLRGAKLNITSYEEPEPEDPDAEATTTDAEGVAPPTPPR